MRPTQKKQLEIVLNLNRLTKNGTIQWEAPEKDDVSGRQHQICRADWKGYQAQILKGDPPDRKHLAVVGTEEPEDYWILIRGREGEEDIVIPPMSAISDLLDTIDRKTDLDTKETTDPNVLDRFNELLEEEL